MSFRYRIPEYPLGGDPEDVRTSVSQIVDKLAESGRVTTFYELELLQTMRGRMLALQTAMKGASAYIEKAPEGTLTVRNSGGHDFFYQVIPGGDSRERYLNRKNSETAAALAQKGYDMKVLREAEAELKKVIGFTDKYETDRLGAIYRDLPDCRKELVTPVLVSGEKFAELWNSVKYKTREFNEDDILEFRTERGERVRSDSERILADLLAEMQIPYRYECPISLDGNILYPTFTALNLRTGKELYWEHFRLMDASCSASEAIRKTALYEACGLFPGKRLIVTQETFDVRPDRARYARIIEAYLK